MLSAQNRKKDRQPVRKKSRQQHDPIWARPAPAARQPRFTREQIALAAIAIADKEGFAQVSMRRIAEDLDAGTMTLYHYVRTKEDLLALIDDALMAEALVPAPELPRGWRAGLTAIAHRSRAAMLRHPWALHSLQGARLGPNGLRHIEQTMAAVADAPMTAEVQLELIAAIDDFVFGYALRAAEWANDPFVNPHAVRAFNEVVGRQLSSGEIPHVAAFIGKEAPAQAFARASKVMKGERRFDFGLAAILDGAERRGGGQATSGAGAGGGSPRRSRRGQPKKR